MTDEQTYAKLASGTSTAKTYPPKADKEDWAAEADKAGLSLSRYLYNLIQEARFMRQQGQLKIGDRRKVEQLQDRIAELEAQQPHQTEPIPDRINTELVDQQLVRQALTDQFQPLNQIIDTVLESDELQSQIRHDVETQLYGFGEQSRAVYRRGHGWKQLGGDR